MKRLLARRQLDVRRVQLHVQQIPSVVHTARFGVARPRMFVHEPGSLRSGSGRRSRSGSCLTPWTSVTWRSASDQTPARGAWTVTQSRPVSTGAWPTHQERFRPVARQYAKRSDAGRIRKRHGSSAPFHSAIALAEGSASSVPTTAGATRATGPAAAARTRSGSPRSRACATPPRGSGDRAIVRRPALGGPDLEHVHAGRGDLGKPVGRRSSPARSERRLSGRPARRCRAGPAASSPRRRAGRARVPAARSKRLIRD